MSHWRAPPVIRRVRYSGWHTVGSTLLLLALALALLIF